MYLTGLVTVAEAAVLAMDVVEMVVMDVQALMVILEMTAA